MLVLQSIKTLPADFVRLGLHVSSLQDTDSIQQVALRQQPWNCCLALSVHPSKCSTSCINNLIPALYPSQCLYAVLQKCPLAVQCDRCWVTEVWCWSSGGGAWSVQGGLFAALCGLGVGAGFLWADAETSLWWEFGVGVQWQPGCIGEDIFKLYRGF